MVRRLALGLAIACSAAACRSHWTAETTEPPLVLSTDRAARTSWPLTIVRRDMELRYARLANTAYFVVVSRDRLRFHLTLRHKWEAMSDLRTWDAWIEDGRGVRSVAPARHRLQTRRARAQRACRRGCKRGCEREIGVGTQRRAAASVLAFLRGAGGTRPRSMRVRCR